MRLMNRYVVLVLLFSTAAALSAGAQDLPLRDPFGGDLTEGLDELLEQPESEEPVTAEASPANPAADLLGLMERAADQLRAGVTGETTQQVQQSIVAKLDSWLGGDPSQGSSSSQASQERLQQQAGEQQTGEQRDAGEPEAGEPEESAARAGEASSEQGSQSAGEGGEQAERPAGVDPPAGQQQSGTAEGADGAGTRAGRPPAAEPDPSGEMAAGGDVWGHLPPRVRDQIRNVAPEDYLPRYRTAIEEYFKRIAEQGR